MANILIIDDDQDFSRAFQRIIERAQGAQFVHRADRAAAGDGQADARCVGLAMGLPGGVQ